MNIDYFKADVVRAAKAAGLDPDELLAVMIIIGGPGTAQRKKFNVLLNLLDIGFADDEVRTAFVSMGSS